MNKSFNYLIVLAITVGTTGFAGNAIASDREYSKHHHKRGLPFIILKMKRQILRNSENIADNFSSINSNTADIADLDSRLSDLESGAPGSGGTVVDVDCSDNPDALLDSPISGAFPAYTTYNLKGACNGPLYVTADGVRFVGVDGTGAAVVLPGPPTNPADGAVFGDGAHDLRIENLLIDVSAWGTGAIAEDTDAAGVYARNSFVRIINTRIVGGLWSINPFRNAIVRTEGLVELIDYVNSGISVGDQSLVTARGPVVFRSDVTDGSYLGAIDIYRGGEIDFRSGVTVNQADADENNGFYPYAIGAYEQSHIRIRNRGQVNIQGNIYLNMLATANIDGGNFAGFMGINENSVMTIRNTTQSGEVSVASGGVLNLQGVNHTGNINAGSGGVMNLQQVDLTGNINADGGSNINMSNVIQSEGQILLTLNSTARMFDSKVGFISAFVGSVFEVNQGKFAGAQISQGGLANIYDASTTSNIQLFGPASLTYGSGSLNWNTIFLCGTTDSSIDPDVVASGTVSDSCG
jgi:hypothetical protein